MIKLYITAIESKEDGSAVTLFEDYQVNFEDINDLNFRPEAVGENLVRTFDEVELANDQAGTPF